MWLLFVVMCWVFSFADGFGALFLAAGAYCLCGGLSCLVCLGVLLRSCGLWCGVNWLVVLLGVLISCCMVVIVFI